MKLRVSKKLSCKEGFYTYLFSDGYKGAKTYVLSGLLPEFPNNLWLDISFNENRLVTDFDIDYAAPATIKVFKNKDLDEYKKNVEFFKSMKNLTWEQVLAVGEGRADFYNMFDFKKADKVHKEKVNNPKDTKRINAILDKCIEKERKKRLAMYSLEELLSTFISIEEEGAYDLLRYPDKIKSLINCNKLTMENLKLHDKDIKAAEEWLNEEINKRNKSYYPLVREDEITEYLTSHSFNLSDEQEDAVYSLCDNRPVIITGGAGSGKTTVIKAIAGCYAKYYGDDKILLLAPTGKASRRIYEQTRFANCGTIHSKLRKSDGFIYYNEKKKLPYRLIIVDESSMIDTLLMSDLLKAVDTDAKIIFIGDHNQLYPVSYGEPFFDFLHVLPVYRLTINFRQGDNAISENADRVLKGLPLIEGKGFTIKHIKYEDIPEYIDKDIQNMSPYNELNDAINQILKKGNNKFNVGDNIVTLTNKEEYSNGDTGKIIALNGDGVSIQINNHIVDIKKKDMSDVALAYSMTIHKMQGSECLKAKLFLPEGDSFIDKRMLYTAITRAKEEMEVYYYTSEK